MVHIGWRSLGQPTGRHRHAATMLGQLATPQRRWIAGLPADANGKSRQRRFGDRCGQGMGKHAWRGHGDA